MVIDFDLCFWTATWSAWASVYGYVILYDSPSSVEAEMAMEMEMALEVFLLSWAHGLALEEDFVLLSKAV